jgi:hypothetical protein
MFLKDSRYLPLRLFEPDPDGRIDFHGVRPRPIGPAEGVVEHMVAEDDRLDRLAHNYYAADRAWWRIVDANAEVVFGPDLLAEDREGDVALIPKRKE